MKKTETITTIVCDICQEQISEKEALDVSYPVIFTTCQSDGASCDPYISQEQLDVCRNCAKKILKVWGRGAQGINKYRVPKD